MDFEKMMDELFAQMSPEILSRSLTVSEIINKIQSKTYFLDEIQTTCESDGDDFVFLCSLNGDRGIQRFNKILLKKYFENALNK